MRGFLASCGLVLLAMTIACANGEMGLAGIGGQLGASTGATGNGNAGTLAGAGGSPVAATTGPGAGPATTSGGGSGLGGSGLGGEPGTTTTTTTTTTATTSTTSTGSGGVPTSCAEANGSVGCCDGSGSYYYCASGSSTVTHTTCSSGKVCGWKSTSNYYACVTAPGTADPTGTNPMYCP